MKNDDVLAVAKFHLFGKTVGGDNFDETVEALLLRSHAFEYGNQTCMVWKWSYGDVQSMDTRYERVSVKTFKEFALKTLRNYCAPSIAIECID